MSKIDYSELTLNKYGNLSKNINLYVIGIIGLNSAAITAAFSHADLLGECTDEVVIFFLCSIVLAAFVRLMPILGEYCYIINIRKKILDKFKRELVDEDNNQDKFLADRGDQQAQASLLSKELTGHKNVTTVTLVFATLKILLLITSVVIFLTGILYASHNIKLIQGDERAQLQIAERKYHL